MNEIGLEGARFSMIAAAGPSIHLTEDSIIFQFGEKIVCTITRDSPEKDILAGLHEFIASFKDIVTRQ